MKMKKRFSYRLLQMKFLSYLSMFCIIDISMNIAHVLVADKHLEEMKCWDCLRRVVRHLATETYSDADSKSESSGKVRIEYIQIL